MTKEEATQILRANVMVACDTSDKVGYGTPLNKAIEQALEMAIKALERDNEEIFKQFKTKAFYESQDILGLDMVDTYMITDYLAELMGVENE